MGTVSPLQPPVNPATKHPIAAVVAWIEAQSKKADMGGTSARLRVTALNQMHEQVADDESRDDAEYLLKNMDRMRERWARRNPSNAAETAQAYASRAKNSIQQYLKWAESPDTYKFDAKRGTRSDDKKGDKKKPSRQVTMPLPPIVPVTPIAHAAEPPPTPPQIGDERNFPLGEGRGAIVFTLPTTGITFADVRKFSVHLFTLASDFDIADADQARVFAMVVRGDMK